MKHVHRSYNQDLLTAPAARPFPCVRPLGGLELLCPVLDPEVADSRLIAVRGEACARKVPAYADSPAPGWID
jgi:hypothetical protein